MNYSEQIMIVYGELVAIEKIVNERKREIEELKHFNGELRYKLPNFQSENKK